MPSLGAISVLKDFAVHFAPTQTRTSSFSTVCNVVLNLKRKTVDWWVHHRAMTTSATPDFPVFMALAKTTKFVSRAGAIPYLWSRESGELEAKKAWKVMILLKQLILILQVLFTLYQALYFAQAKEVPLFQRIYAFYLTFGVIILAYNVVLIYGD